MTEDTNFLVTADLVVIVSSVNGMSDLSTLVSSLPSDFNAPLILVQMLASTNLYDLTKHLEKVSKLPVELVTSDRPLLSGHIYVLPFDSCYSVRQGIIEGGEAADCEDSALDLLLSSAAKAYQNNLIVVALTDFRVAYVVKVLDVKEAGGMVIAQSPPYPRFPVPAYLPPTLVDLEAKPENMGDLLDNLVKKANLPLDEIPEEADRIFQRILKQVNLQTRLNFSASQKKLFVQAIKRRVVITGQENSSDYADYLEIYPSEIGILANLWLNNFPRFFRDREAFTYLKDEVLPNLISEARKNGRNLRFWSAGCATGEEAYSLAILIADLLGAELAEWNIKIFATDVNEAAIAFARRGLYSDNLLKNVPKNYLSHFFERTNQGYSHISKTLRQMVIFGLQDLQSSAPFPYLDLILCRNVLIYFTPELQTVLLQRFTFSLANKQGFLFLGQTDSGQSLPDAFKIVSQPARIYRCIGTVSLVPNSGNFVEPGYSLPKKLSILPNEKTEGKALSRPEVRFGAEGNSLNQFIELLQHLPLGLVIIDRYYRMVSANQLARQLLGIQETGGKQDFLHAVRGVPYVIFREAIDRVFRERHTITLPELELLPTSNQGSRYLLISITLIPPQILQLELVSISVTDITEQVQNRRQLEAGTVNQVQQLTNLTLATQNLSEMNKQLIDANEELLVVNEELVLTHEELQSSLEEFETTNEELQAVNEELETSNEEKEATNEELQATNDELEARTIELEELYNQLNSERRQLSEMVELAPFYIMVLSGPQLLVKAFNPRYARFLESKEVLGRPLESVSRFFWENGKEVVELAQQVYQQNVTRTTPRMLTRLPDEADEQVETWLVFTVVPSHDVEGKVAGIVIYTSDETEQYLKEVEEERERLQLIFEHAEQIALALYDAQKKELLTVSPHYLSMARRAGVPAEENLIGQKWSETTFILSEEEATQLWETALESGKPVHRPEIRTKLKLDERETVWDWSLSPIHYSPQRPILRYMLVSIVEITDQIQVQEELKRLDRLKDDFLSITSHELRTPLTTISGYVQLLQSQRQKFQLLLEEKLGDSPSSAAIKRELERENHSLNRIVEQVGRMRRLIMELTDVSRLRTQQFELKMVKDIDMITLIRRVIEAQQNNTPSHSLTLETEQEPVLVTMDKFRIEQVLENLISNAVKYSPPGKAVWITVSLQQNQAGLQEVVVAVQDEGQGISPAEQTHIFEQFYRVQSEQSREIEGLGLGLYFSREVILKHGGRIWLESELDKGSTFYFALPLRNGLIRTRSIGATEATSRQTIAINI